MKMLTIVLSLCTAPLLAMQTGAQPARGATDPAIAAVADHYVKATLAGDAKAVAALYTEDAVEMPPNLPAVKGRAAIQQLYEMGFKEAKISQFLLPMSRAARQVIPGTTPGPTARPSRQLAARRSKTRANMS